MANLTDVEIRHLVALRAVAVEGSFGRAAQRLGFSQSAISQQIGGLERVVGGPVFDRPGGPRPVVLTPAGRLLLRHAEVVLERMALAGEELDDLRAGTGGRLTVGTFQSVSVKLLPAIVGRALTEAPGLDIRLHETDDQDELIRRLVDDDLDVAFLFDNADDERIDAIEICLDPFVLLLPPGLAPGEDGSFPLAELDGRGIVGQNACSAGDLVDVALRAAGIAPRYVFRSDDNGAVQAMVRAGMGAAILPFLAVNADDPGVCVARLDPPLAPRTISIARRRGRTSSPAADRFVELALQLDADRMIPAELRSPASTLLTVA